MTQDGGELKQKHFNIQYTVSKHGAKIQGWVKTKTNTHDWCEST